MPQMATWLPSGELLQLADDLLSQFAGRRQDDAPGARALRASSISIKRDAERGGLAGSRLGLADDVESVECLGNEGRLNGGGRQIPGVLEGLEHGGAQAHREEPERGFLCNTSNQSILHRNSRYGVFGMEAVGMARDSFKFSDHPLLTI